METREKVGHIVHQKYPKQRRKLNALRIQIHRTKSNNANVSDHKFLHRFKNLTDVFTEEQTRLIGRGFNYNMISNSMTNTFENLVVDEEIALKTKPHNTEHLVTL